MAHESSKDRLIARLKDALAAAESQNQGMQAAVQAHLDNQEPTSDRTVKPTDTGY